MNQLPCVKQYVLGQRLKTLISELQELHIVSLRHFQIGTNALANMIDMS